MFVVLQIVSIFLVSIAMSLSWRMRWSFPASSGWTRKPNVPCRRSTIPVFTFGGFSEGLGIVALLAVLLMTPTESAAFPWTLIGFIAFVAMHSAYWIITHPVNKFWLKDQDLKGFSAGFFRFDPLKRHGQKHDAEETWKSLRDRWEYSHVLRAVLAALALVALAVAIA